MPKANRTCHCCGREYYYCPSCPDDKRNPGIYVMWDSELCKEIFKTLIDESTKEITTLECKNKLIELGVNKSTVLKESVRKHVDRVMDCKEEIVEEVSNETLINIEEKHVTSDDEIIVKNIVENTVVKDIIEVNAFETTKEIDNAKKYKRTKKSSLKNIENSEVD